jgi:hypothetical protein
LYKDVSSAEDFKVGQNIAQFWNNVGPEVQWATAIGSWYDEVSNWSSADTPKFRYRSCEPRAVLFDDFWKICREN